jgi:signal transduction histidine kinase
MLEKDPQGAVPHNDVVRLIGIAALLWVSYMLALAVIDRVFYPVPLFPTPYYMVNGLNALLVLSLAAWTELRHWLGRACLPTVIGLMSVSPILINQIFVVMLPSTPAIAPENITLRLMPILFMALALTAWQYQWKQVVWFSLGLAAFRLSLYYVLPRPAAQLVLPPITALMVQTISLLVVGYFITSLMQQLRAQHDSLAQANAQLVHYAGTLEQLTISRERNRMARELHDTLAHTLSGLSVQLETVKAYLEVNPAAAQTMLDQSLTVTRSGLQETRRALKSLRASPLDDLGLALAISQLAHSAAERANLQLDLIVPNPTLALSPDVEQCIYRVAQEAIANVAHHANARHLSVTLACEVDQVTLLIEDDGRGFDVRQGEQAGHYGLAGMRERAALIGARLNIESQPGNGTRLQLAIRGATA